MPTDSPIASRGSRRFAPTRYVVRIGQDWSPIRAAAIWPIADVLAAEPGLEDVIPAPASPAAEVGLVLDLIDSGMIAPPRPRSRRERAVSSRAVFYQAADA